MGILDTLLGNDAANASKAAAADKYAKQQRAGGEIRAFGDQYADQFRRLAGGYDPYVEAGGEAAGQFTRLLRDPSSVRSLPGYEFNRTEGMRGVENSAAARSGILNGKTLKDVDRFNTNYADTMYGNQFQRLMGATGQGQGAVGAQVGTEATGLQGQLGTRQSAYGGDMTSAGTIGEGDIAAANAKAKAMQGLMDFGGKIGGAMLGGGFGSVTGGGGGNILAQLLGGGGKMDNPHWYGQRAGVDF